jgi:hypothetical protein
MSDVKAETVTLEFFKALLPALEFKVLDYPTRYGYEGASEFCLYANAENAGYVLDVLYEGGNFQVYGFDGVESWCVQVSDDGEVELL